MLINPKGSPFYIFWHYATFSERKKFQKLRFFKKIYILRFLSRRFSADFRRSRLVIFKYDTTDLIQAFLEKKFSALQHVCNMDDSCHVSVNMTRKSSSSFCLKASTKTSIESRRSLTTKTTSPNHIR